MKTRMNSCVGKKKKTSNKVLRLIIIQRRNSTFFFFLFHRHSPLFVKKFYNRDSSIIHPFDWLGKLEKQSTAGYLQFSLSRGSKRVPPPTVEYFRDAGIVRTPFDVHSYVNLSGEPN